MEAKYIKKLWKLKDYEKVKGDLFIRVLNIKRNRDILDEEFTLSRMILL